ncbi:hypothetical protein BaRGS_00025798 [Batillaria attramentaria]|uniref:Uncharacterized protein n=1 Tax=Batillaria attramentaria TaxID=370345 RepID=A0ABD0K710_9CAEN
MCDWGLRVGRGETGKSPQRQKRREGAATAPTHPQLKLEEEEAARGIMGGHKVKVRNSSYAAQSKSVRSKSSSEIR